MTYVGIVNRDLLNNLEKLLDLVAHDGVDHVESRLEDEWLAPVAAVWALQLVPATLLFGEGNVDTVGQLLDLVKDSSVAVVLSKYPSCARSAALYLQANIVLLLHDVILALQIDAAALGLAAGILVDGSALVFILDAPVLDVLVLGVLLLDVAVLGVLVSAGDNTDAGASA